MTEKNEPFPLQPDAVDLLIRDHETMDRLIHEALPPSGAVSDLERAAFEAERPQRLESLRREIEGHLVVEEQVFYPFLLKFDEFKTWITRCHDEHRGLRSELQAILREGQSHERVTKGLRNLQSDLYKHVSFEERDLFPMVRKMVSRPEREALALTMTQERQNWKRTKEKAA